jgi:phosphatidate cytidylyltransferase
VAEVEPASSAGGNDPPGASGRSNLALRVLSALVMAPLAIVAAYIGEWPFGVFWTIAAIGVWWEWNALVCEADNRLLFILGAASLVLAFAITEVGGVRTPMLILALGALGAGVFAQAERRIWVAGGLIYAGAVVMGPIVVRRDPELGFTALIFIFAIVWATDIVGYFVGRALGGPKLAPAISPKKTWSGALGGTAAAIVIGLGVATFAGLGNMFAIANVALALSVISQAGDLFESAIKRCFNAKDASQLIPGHGGLMDRLDGFIAAAAAAAIFGTLRGGMDAAASGLLLW